MAAFPTLPGADSEPVARTYGTPQSTSAAWSVGGRIGGQLIQLVGFVVLSHLLGPRSYGVMSVAGVFIGFAQIFTDIGIGPAVVTRPNLTEGYLTAAFVVNAASGVVIAAIVAPCGLLLAAWFDLPSLRWVVPVLCIGFVVSVSPVSLALLEREFRFRSVALIEVGAALVSQVGAIILASAGGGLLSLALMPVMSAALISGGAICVAGWWPHKAFTRNDLRVLRDYVAPLAIFNSVTFWSRNSDNLVIGKIFGPGMLAYYSRAYALMLAPIQQVNTALDRFLQAAFAADRTHLLGLARRHRAAEATAAAFGFTLCAITVPISDDLVRTVFGSRWAPMSPLLAILAASIAPQVVTGVNGSLLRATGNTRLLLRLGSINAALFVIAVVTAAMWSVNAVAWSLTGVSYLTVLVTLAPTARKVGLDLRPILTAIVRQIWPPACLLLILLGFRHVHAPDARGGRLALELGIATLGASMIAFRSRKHWAEVVRNHAGSD
jgi:PST family polysaccharide transporter